ncbi:MAG: AbrB/MazE/SpoVT family DNA-binding domain-containing protein [Propionibacteriales bacterium]|nr:AbrB/MazE/SpoVT family DNA-binding domain-containing protein [Propionibacteriales bacterium]
MSVATVTSKGQITIPKDVRDELGLEPGTKVDFVRVSAREFRLRPRNVEVADLFGILKYDGPPITIEEMNEAIRDGWAGIER